MKLKYLFYTVHSVMAIVLFSMILWGDETWVAGVIGSIMGLWIVGLGILALRSVFKTANNALRLYPDLDENEATIGQVFTVIRALSTSQKT